MGLSLFGMNFKGKVLAKKLACGNFSGGLLRDPFRGVIDRRFLLVVFCGGVKIKSGSGAHVDAGDVKRAAQKHLALEPAPAD